MRGRDNRGLRRRGCGFLAQADGYLRSMTAIGDGYCSANTIGLGIRGSVMYMRGCEAAPEPAFGVRRGCGALAP